MMPRKKLHHEGYESLKRISINEKNTKTSEITIPYHREYQHIFFLETAKQ